MSSAFRATKYIRANVSVKFVQLNCGNHSKLCGPWLEIDHFDKRRKVLLVLCVTPFKLDQNKNEPPFDHGLSPESEKRKKGTMQRLSPRFRSQQFFLLRMRDKRRSFSPKFIRDLYRNAMLVPIRMGTNMAAGNQQKHLSLSFATKA